MTTLCIAEKNGELSLAWDSSISFGPIRVPTNSAQQNPKGLKVNGGLVAVTGCPTHVLALEILLLDYNLNEIRNRSDLFLMMNKIHTDMKERFHLQVNEEEFDPYESSQFSALIGCNGRIYSVHSYREVIEHGKFWALGSGSDFALGAMASVYDTEQIEGITRHGLKIACTFDPITNPPFAFIRL